MVSNPELTDSREAQESERRLQPDVQEKPKTKPEDLPKVIDAGIKTVEDSLAITPTAYGQASERMGVPLDSLVVEPDASDLAQSRQQLQAAEGQLHTLGTVLSGEALPGEPKIVSEPRAVAPVEPTIGPIQPTAETGPRVDGVRVAPVAEARPEPALPSTPSLDLAPPPVVSAPERAVPPAAIVPEPTAPAVRPADRSQPRPLREPVPAPVTAAPAAEPRAAGPAPIFIRPEPPRADVTPQVRRPEPPMATLTPAPRRPELTPVVPVYAPDRQNTVDGVRPLRYGYDEDDLINLSPTNSQDAYYAKKSSAKQEPRREPVALDANEIAQRNGAVAKEVNALFEQRSKNTEPVKVDEPTLFKAGDRINLPQHLSANN